jgi:hypothetical protein
VEYAPTAHNRTVYASGAVAPSGYEKPQSALRPLCGFSPPHFCKPWKPTVSFIGLQKRHIQPERYMQLRLNFFEFFEKKY